MSTACRACNNTRCACASDTSVILSSRSSPPCRFQIHTTQIAPQHTARDIHQGRLRAHGTGPAPAGTSTHAVDRCCVSAHACTHTRSASLPFSCRPPERSPPRALVAMAQQSSTHQARQNIVVVQYDTRRRARVFYSSNSMSSAMGKHTKHEWLRAQR